MVSARAAFGTARTRRPAGPLRLLWLAALLFAFLYTHAAGADSASAHVTGGVVAVPHLAPAETDVARHGHGETPAGHDSDNTNESDSGHHSDSGHGHSHPAEACASGQPQQGCDLPGPHLAPLEELTPAFAARPPQLWARTLPSGLPPSRSSLGSVVQQV